MNLQQFQASLTEATPPANLSLALQALWQAGKGDWKAAHTLAQSQEDQVGSWVHAYLHREEGDAANAAYWYRRADQPVATQPLAEEWAAIAGALLNQ